MTDTTTDPTPETAKDRQLIYWQQQCSEQEQTIERLRQALEEIGSYVEHRYQSGDMKRARDEIKSIISKALK